ncbi:polyketide cyclase [Flavihumibacter sp. R14]|nr:polyketide cyclase [Flavihumibacter soli]
MQIRKPAAEVFNAFIDPAITTNFWFTKSSGKLEIGKDVKWEWEMYNVSATVATKEIVPNEKIVFEWGEPERRTVEFSFKSLSDGSTYVTAKEYGYRETGDALIAAIKDSTGGFTTVLDGLKAWLEHGINLNLIGDKFPKEVMQHGK